MLKAIWFQSWVQKLSNMQRSGRRLTTAAAASLGSWWDLQTLGPHPRPAESETKGSPGLVI